MFRFGLLYIGASYMHRTSKNPKPILKVSDMSLFSVYSSSTHTFGQSLFMSEGKSHVCNLPSVLFWKQKKEMRLNSCDTCESYGPACLNIFPSAFVVEKWWTKKKGDFTNNTTTTSQKKEQGYYFSTWCRKMWDTSFVFS